MIDRIVVFVCGVFGGMVLFMAIGYSPVAYERACAQAFVRAHSGTDTVAIIRATDCRPKEAQP